MGILTKEVEVKLWGRTIKYYNDLGYSGKRGDIICVKIKDLPLRSDTIVECQCDYCGKTKKPMKYSDYNTQTKNGTEKCCCAECASIKQEESMIKKYGYGHAMQNPEMKNKIQETNLVRYGSVSPFGNIGVRQKQKETMIKRYGTDIAMHSKEIQDKFKNTMMEKYGVENAMLNEDLKNKARETTYNNYGVENSFLSKEVRDRRDATLLSKYGTIYPLQNEKCFKKMKTTNLKIRGVEFVSQSEDAKQKVKQTNLKHYGCENPMQSQEVLEKWFKKNGSNFVKASSQQRYLCNLYNGILNHPFKCFALDIFISEDSLNIEYDGSGHKMCIALGNVTEEEFERKELYRNVAIKNNGYKQMRIVSTKDFLPSDEILLQMLEHTKEYFSNYPEHSWIEFNIDSSTVRNAEQKEGVFFNYGELRKIKKSDLQREIIISEESA